MKTKLFKLVGIALTVVLLASLTIGLATVPAGAASSNLKFVKLEMPKIEAYDDHTTFDDYTDAIAPDEFSDAEGGFWCTPAIDLGPIAQTPDGEILFAAVADGFYNNSAWFHLLKSTDGGYSWTATGFYDDAATGDSIVDIVTSPEYADDTTLAVATEDFVYISEDGGKNFTALDDPWGGTINDLDITMSEDDDVTLIVATTEPEVYVTSGLLAWTSQEINDLAPLNTITNVLACAFLPTFAADGDIGICAVVTDNGAPTTTMTFSFADISEGGEWGDDIANAPFTNASGIDFDSDAACIAFPDDFDAFGTGNNICFVGLVADGDFGALTLSEESGSDAYEVALKEAGTSSATDLDVRGVLTTLLPTATAVTSIDVCGDAEEATILVGTDAINVGDTPMYFSSYISQDSGEEWDAAKKCPTGGAEVDDNVSYERVNTRVMMAPDFCDSGLAYASTWGYKTDAFQRTTDFGESWNQISIIDYGLDTYSGSVSDVAPAYTIPSYGFSASGYIANDTLWMTTWNYDYDDNGSPGDPSDDITTPLGAGAFWGLIDGNHWERMLSYANPGVTDTLQQVGILGDGSAMFISDLTNCSIWRSSDMGATFPKKISTKDFLTWVTPVSSTTLYTTHLNGELWWTERSGTGWEKPDDSEIPNSAMLVSVSVAGDIVYGGTNQGSVFFSSDGGETVEMVGSDDPFAGGMVLAGTDLGFAANGILYAIGLGQPDVMRCVVDLDDPGDSEWEQIDDNQDSTGDVVYDEDTLMAASPPLAMPPSGVLYVVDMDFVVTGDDDELEGGLWRCTNPTADTDSVAPPYFERENKGLDDNDMVALMSLDLNGAAGLAPTFFFHNYTVPYYEQVVMYTDILHVGVPLTSPTADETGVGLLPEGYVYPEVILYWEEMAGATSYQYQVAVDAAFKTSIDLSDLDGGFTESLASGTLVLHPNTTYYWRVRVANEGSLLGAPLISPWSEVRKFKTAIGASMARPALQAPWPGEPDVPLSPTFEWSGIEWAEVYEYELSTDPATTAGGYFASPLVSLTGTDSLVSTAWKCDITLDYNTRYYWQVKAIGVDTDTPWSDVGTFTTMGVPAEPAEPGEAIVIPPAQEITPAWIWAIVIIGAILVIAVIVLIVTTRRVP